MLRAVWLLDDLKVGVILVCEGDKLPCKVIDRDIVVCGIAQSLDGQARLSTVTSGQVRCATEVQPIDKVLCIMAQAQTPRMPVVDAKQKRVGIVTIGDIAA